MQQDQGPLLPSAALLKTSSLLATALSVDPELPDDSELCETLVGIETARKQLDALSARVLTEADRRRVTDTAHGQSTGGWLAREANLPCGATRARVRIANKLHSRMPGVLDALEQGRVAWDHAAVLARAANPRIIGEFNEMVPELVDLAEQMTFEAWKREVRGIAELLDADGGHRPGDDISDNRLSLSGLFDNTIVISGQLCGELALIVRDAIGDRADLLFKRMTRDNEETNGELRVPPRATLQALALVELIREALGSGSRGRAPQAEVSLIINADDPNEVTDRNGVLIGDTGRYACLCDPVFTPIIMNTQGIVTNLGRTQRLASDAQRKAMAHRDGGCVFPGCDRPPEWTDAHHSWHWTKGGPTDLHLLASLCRHHHIVTHRKNWTMTATPDQWFTWTTPTGQTIHSQRHGRQKPPNPEPPGTQTPGTDRDDECSTGSQRHATSRRGTGHVTHLHPPPDGDPPPRHRAA